MKFLKKLLLNSIFIFIIPYFLKGIHIDGFFTALLFTLAMALLNVLLKPVLIVLSFPITVFTLGLFIVVINTILVYLAAFITGGVQINNFIYGLIFSLIISFITSIVDWVIDSNSSTDTE